MINTKNQYPSPASIDSQPRIRFRNSSSDAVADSIWRQLRDDEIWKHTSFEAHEQNTLIGAGNRTEWTAFFPDWFPIFEGQIWCHETRRSIDPVYIPADTRPARMEDFLGAARAFFSRFKGRRIGVQLSGGFDSSLVIGLLRHFQIDHGLVGLKSDRFEFRTERYIQECLAAQNCRCELIDEESCLPCSKLDDVPPHQIPDLLSLDYAQDAAMAAACNRLGIDVLLSGGGGDNLLGQAVPENPLACAWRPQTFTDDFPVEFAYRPRGIQFLSFFSAKEIVDTFYRLRRGQEDDYRKRWAREFFQEFVPRELVDYNYFADFWGRSIDGLVLALDDIHRQHRKAFAFTGNPYFADDQLQSLISQDIYRPNKEIHQRIEARISSAVWACSLSKWLEIKDWNCRDYKKSKLISGPLTPP